MKKMIQRVCVCTLSLALVLSLLPMSAFAATVEANKTCKLEEHKHTDECYEITTGEDRTLTCEESTEGHTHGDDCYAWKHELNCEEQEEPAHTHSVEAGCFEENIQVVTCGNEDPEHKHEDNCYTTQSKLTCTESDLPTHKHTTDCYTDVRGELLCALEENTQPHEHTDECYEIQEASKTLTCEKEEHTHDATCYEGKTVDGISLEEALKKALEDAGKAGAEDTTVTLILNGQTLNYQYGGGSNSESGNALAIRNGQTLNIEDAIGGGGIKGNGDSIRLIVVTNGTVNLSSGTLSGGTGTGGGAIYVGANGSLNMTGGAISDNTAIKGSNGGAVLVENGGKFEMSGGTISGNTAANGGGVSVGQGSQFTMTGGTIDGNTAEVGGGVYVGVDATNSVKGGEFTLTGGTISNNTATNEGGGVFVDRKYSNSVGSFTMSGGTIDGNIAEVGEGGGVYIKGNGTITNGAITNNATYTHEDLGGGGIYIETDGVLTLKNAIITSNTANGLGGGIAACVHGKTVVYALKGAAIFGNNALGQGHTQGHVSTDSEGNPVYNGGFIDGYTYWASAEEIVKQMGQDIFAASDGFEASFGTSGVTENSQGTSGILVSNTMPGGDNTVNWEGYTYCYVTDENGDPVKDDNGNYMFELTQVTENNNSVVYGNRLLFLTANPTPEAIKEAIAFVENQERVIIAGNLSANSHGGGIANNGMLTIGEGEMNGTNSYRPQPELDKTLESNDENVTIADKTFTFELLDENGNLVEGGSVTNDAQGKAQFTFPAGTFDSIEFAEGETEKELVFFVREVNDNQENVTYDGTLYRITIKVVKCEEKVKIGHEEITVETLTVGEPTFEKSVLDENGQPTDQFEAADGIRFANTYTKPQDPPDNPDKEDPGDNSNEEDPGDSKETPPPSEEINEPEVPLAEKPEEVEKLERAEEEVEIDDPDVPLSDVPQTGDLSMAWYAAVVMSALGLLILTVLGRKRARES